MLLRCLLSLLISFAIAYRSLRKKSLDLSGAIAGFLVLSIHIAAGFSYGILILVFFFTSSKLTKFGVEKKKMVDADFKESGQRNWMQVMCNSAIATALVVSVGVMTGWQDRCLDTKDSVRITCLIGGIIGHYACCNGDTWSSEYGVLSNASPRLITSFKKVPKGTNGAVTVDGLLAAVAAGTVIGLAYYLLGLATTLCSPSLARRQLLIIPVSATAGLFGSLIDSLLGATIQFSGYCKLRKKVVGKPGPTVKCITGMDILDNNGVNFVSILITTLLTATACSYIF